MRSAELKFTTYVTRASTERGKQLCSDILLINLYKFLMAIING